MEVAMSCFSSGKSFAKIAAKMTAGVVLAALIAVNCPTAVNGAVTGKPEISRHDYKWDWVSVTEEFLTPLDDGGYMVFRLADRYLDEENFESETPYFVEYYDKSLKCVSEKRIKIELPVFGGFYADASGYYVLTGRENEKMSANVECFRLTKYDKDWNRIGSCGLKDCNTTYPFDCGCSMTAEGKYMAVRCGHSMYGGHQANVTILIDTSEMKILDSQYEVSNEVTGYCSHSFNQCVRIEDNHIIGVDHGDAHPRAIKLWHYGADIASGKFQNVAPKRYTVLPIGGAYEVFGNYTGATLGGFEISSSSYLIAGSSIDQDRFPADDNEWANSNLSRNIFVSVFDKSSGNVQIKWLTTSESGVEYSNPFLVKINDNSYAVIWSRTRKEDTVYYAFIDGKGNMQGSVKSAKGAVSDCQPVVSGNKIVWYGYDRVVLVGEDLLEYEGMHFYSIDLSDKSFSSKAVYDLDINQPKNGKASLPYLKAPAGEEITINVTPDEGYELSYILVNGKRLTGNKFTVPDEPVDITVNFKKEGSPNLDDVVNVGDYSYQVTNSDTEGAGTVMLTGVVNPVEAVVVPATIDINGYIYKVNRIGGTAFFEDQTVKTVYLNANVVVIDKNAFYGCPNLVKVSGGAGLKTIGDNAFARCPKLSSFIITSKVLYKIGAQAFYKDTKLKTIYIKNTTKLTKGGVKKSLKGSSVKTVKVKKSKIWKYKKFFKKSNSGKKVKVKK